MGEYRHRIVDDELDLMLAELPAILVEGAKGVGKTATALEHAAGVRRLDHPGPRQVMAADMDRGMRGPAPLLIDEWQYLPDVWDRVRRAVDDGAPPGSFLLTGSSSPVSTGTHSGTGRIVRVRMRPMSLAERLAAGDTTVSLARLLGGGRTPIAGSTCHGLDFYVDEIVRSGFPGIRYLSAQARRYRLNAYVAGVIDKDFEEFGRVLRRPDSLRRWLAAYGAATATTATFESIRDAATGGHGDKPARSATIPYRDVLERLFIVDPVPGWQPSRNHIGELGLAPKHHLADPALATTLLGIGRDALVADGRLLGALFESLVTLSVRVYAQNAGARIGHLRAHRGRREVDLIVERPDGAVVAIEVKLTATVEGDSLPHLTWLGEQMGDRLLDRVVITTGSDAFRRRDGVAVVPAALLGP